ncbi:MAG TPA: glycoside hydrolase [Ignavibacteriales bacterium]|nr:glycoside hydrolase [Ignavibacteriales bacterium]
MFLKLLILFLCLSFFQSFAQVDSWIRVNQLGYLPNTPKVAVLISKKNILLKEFLIKEVKTKKIVYTSNSIQSFGSVWNFNSNFRLDFSSFKDEGIYFIECENVRSNNFKIAKNVYNGTADFLLKYMRQQRCGYNPFLKDSCHTKDGFIIYNPKLDSTHIDVTGGWHDASDYLQYVTTSANAVYQMLFAYKQNPGVFTDEFDANGNEGSNKIPDILDEAKWGIDWLLKMNPEKDMIFNQIADDRDHMGFRLPNKDTISYGKGLERPVYFATGTPQGIFKYQNRSTGLASTAGKFASAFALASELLKNYYPELSITLLQKAIEAYELGKEYPGVCQTAPCRAPYFYEEENFRDDMELAASQLFLVTKNNSYLNDGIVFGNEEKIIPWMGADTAKHYEWYPFVNLGHYLLTKEITNGNKETFLSYIKNGIEKVVNRGKDNPFNIGVPFIWCSNNLVAAMLTQLRLYNNLTGDNQFLYEEAALRDWLFGCNPWGTSMIVGLPSEGDYPSDPHSAFTHLYNYPVNGGLIDGPVYYSIYSKLIGITLYSPDEYAEFQNGYVVYHDDYGDYSTNEPTMDGTASLTYYLSAMEMFSK